MPLTNYMKIHKIKNEELYDLLEDRARIVNQGRKNSQLANSILKKELIKYLETDSYDFDMAQNEEFVTIRLKSGDIKDLIKAVQQNEEEENKLIMKVKQIDERSGKIIQDEKLAKTIVLGEFGKITQYKNSKEKNIIDIQEVDAVKEFKEYFREQKAKHNGIE